MFAWCWMLDARFIPDGITRYKLQETRDKIHIAKSNNRAESHPWSMLHWEWNHKPQFFHNTHTHTIWIRKYFAVLHKQLVYYHIPPNKTIIWMHKIHSIHKIKIKSYKESSMAFEFIVFPQWFSSKFLCIRTIVKCIKRTIHTSRIVKW